MPERLITSASTEADIAARFDDLVEWQEACGALTEGHMAALEFFRCAGFRGRPLDELPSKPVSLPGFRRWPKDGDTLPPFATQSGTGGFELAMSSTCAVVRSILRCPGVRYEHLRPLHLVLELLAMQQRQPRSPTVPSHPLTLRLGHLGDLAEVLSQALKSLPHEDEPPPILDRTPKAMFARGVAEALGQVIRDMEKLAEAPVATAGLRDAAGIAYSVNRFARVAYLARGSNGSWAALEAAADAVASELAASDPDTLHALISTVDDAWAALVAGTTPEDPSSGGDGPAERLLALAADLPVFVGRPAKGFERWEAAAAVEVLMRQCHDALGLALKTARSYQGLKAEPSTPAHPYVLYWVLSGLRGHDDRDEEGEEKTASTMVRFLREACNEYHRLLALADASEARVDAIRLGYHLALEAEFNPNWDRSLARAAVRQLVSLQHEDGSFDKQDRMWLGIEGDAYGLAVELLTTLLIAFDKHPEFLELIEPALVRCRRWLDREAARPRGTAETGRLWAEQASSTYRAPQAWVSGEAYSFLYLSERYFSRALAELAVRRFDGKGASAATGSGEGLAKVSADFWCAGVERPPSVGDVVYKAVIKPLQSRHRYFGTYQLSPRATRSEFKRSGILYGPPGTGKTTLAVEMAAALGWPLIMLSPYDFLARGSEGVAQSAKDVFRWLSKLRDCVVLFDEMEELFRSRVGRTGPRIRELGDETSVKDRIAACAGTVSEGEGKWADVVDRGIGEPFYVQRLWTSLFLPLLQQLHDEASLVFLVATNHFHNVDLAIARPGRFDFRINMLPPTVARKIDILMEEIEKPLALSADEAAKLAPLLHADFAEDRVLAEDSLGMTTIPAAAKDRPNIHARPVKTEISAPTGIRWRSEFHAGFRFRFFTRADTVELARAVVSRLRGFRDGVGDVPDAVRRAVLQEFAAIVPTGFHYEPGADYLEESGLRRTE